ncbi:hypothetical protein H9I45_08125 [Polaribacter haliotis]|uniref:N-acetylglutamate synthase n=1 Tax=Polaribacter haliotis TaxID=1888915 RepID=A0A7L8ABC2_9FLAO|nr:hypothetical protein [Polaribacter haliotis]QOD59343.1 hypothetical protein H9I45_08125 [Polaribacter haliotis]
MDEFNFNNKVFHLIENSKSGKVNSETVFNYQQKGNIVTADYNGGTIKYGKIIATLDKDILNMMYQCVTSENELKAGKATAKVSFKKENKIHLKLNWQWLNDNQEKGVSEYIEN